MNNKHNKINIFLVAIIMIMGLGLVMINDELQYARKTSLASAQYCIKYTSDIMIKGSTELTHSRSAHEYDLSKANSNIEDLIYRYNKLAKRLRMPELNPYGFIVPKS